MEGSVYLAVEVVVSMEPVVEGGHQGLSVDGVAQHLLLHLLLVRAARVVVEGVVRCLGALEGKHQAQRWSQGLAIGLDRLHTLFINYFTHILRLNHKNRILSFTHYAKTL